VRAPGTPLRRPWHAVTAGRAQASTRLLVDHLLDAGRDDGWHVPGRSG
jgi:LysR family transcriptional regulator, low CO2-responsive transcriptional regulator